MAKKYLLTFSLAVISCLATKSIQEVLDVEDKNEPVEIANNESPKISPNGQPDLDMALNRYSYHPK